MNNVANRNDSIDLILHRISKIKPKNKVELVNNIRNILDSSFIESIDSSNTPSVVFIFRSSRKKYVMKMEFSGNDNSVSKQLQWYQKVGRGLPYIPKLISYLNTGSFCIYVLEYIDGSRTLDEVVLNSKNISSNLIFNTIDDSLNKFVDLFHKHPTRQLTNIEAAEYIMQKYDVRKSKAFHYPFLANLFLKEKIIINGEDVLNYGSYIRRILENNKLRSHLTPISFGTIHGDLHCGNILVDENFSPHFVDPNGNLSLPVEYDYGKIFHSLHGGFGSVMTGKYKLKKTGLREYEFSIDIPQSYAYTFNKISSKLKTNFLIRGLYLEAMHFSTMLSHHANEEKETTALYLRGLMLFKELFNIINL